MISIKEIRDMQSILTVADLQYERDERKKLRQDMVGTLYPSVLYDEEQEIAQLQRQKEVTK